MFLNELTIEQLKTLSDAIGLVQRGAQLLSALPLTDAGDQLTVSLHPGKPVTIRTTFRMPAAIGQGFAVEVDDGPMQVVEAARDVVIAPIPVKAVVAPPAKRGVPPREWVKEAAATVKTGTFTDEENEQIRALLSAGKSKDEIARALNRKVGGVTLQMSRLSKSATVDAEPAPDPAPVRADPPIAVGPAAKVQLCSRQREIDAALSVTRSRRGFDAELDLEIAEGFAGGISKEELALDLGCDLREMMLRYADLTSTIRDARGMMASADQAHLLTVLRARCVRARGAK